MTAPAATVAGRVRRCGSWITNAMKSNTTPKAFRLLPALGFLTLILGGLAGLGRLGLQLPYPVSMAGVHGLAMVSGFLGLVIGCERAVALGRLWAWSVPLLAVAGSAALLSGRIELAFILYTVEAAAFTAVAVRLWFLQSTLPMGLMVFAALGWLAGNLAFQNQGASLAVVFAWAAFPVWTVVAERLELAAGARVTRAGRAWLALAALAWIAVLALPQGVPAAAAGSLSLIILGPWLLRFDVARLHLKHPGERTFLGVCLITGYAWLAFAAPLCWLAFASDLPLARDAFLHSLFLGFLFSMIFAHAQLILPALTGRALAFGKSFYLHLGLLHLSLLVRVGADLTQQDPLRRAAAIANLAALFIFILNNLFAMIRAAKLSRESSPAAS